MRMEATALGMALFVALVVALPAGAHHDGCHGVVTNILVVDDETTLYFEDRSAGGLWLYLESSGSTGLQRGGSLRGLVADPCGDPAVADTLLAHVSDVGPGHGF